MLREYAGVRSTAECMAGIMHNRCHCYVSSRNNIYFSVMGYREVWVSDVLLWHEFFQYSVGVSYGKNRDTQYEPCREREGIYGQCPKH